MTILIIYIRTWPLLVYWLKQCQKTNCETKEDADLSQEEINGDEIGQAENMGTEIERNKRESERRSGWSIHLRKIHITHCSVQKYIYDKIRLGKGKIVTVPF
jgi:hypothetical protein